MDQPELFHETIYDALTSDILACGGFKKVAGTLFPSKTLDSAYAYLKNTMREEAHEKLGAEEILKIIAMACEIKSFATINYQCDNAHLSRPTPIKPENEQAELARQFTESVKIQGQIMKRMEKLAQSGFKELG